MLIELLPSPYEESMTDVIAPATRDGVTTPSDDELIAEIAPAMLAKLKQDGTTRGQSMGGQIMIAGLLLSSMGHKDSPFEVWLLLATVVLCFGSAAGLIFLPGLFWKRYVAAEVRYRRLHSKWRWDR
jgi:hypothetical protein